jgi:hypothetical protein
MRLRGAISAVLVVASLSAWASGRRATRQAPPPGGGVTSSGGTVQPASSADLDLYVKNYDYAQLEQDVDAMPQSPDRDYFRGVLANRTNRLADSIELLTAVLPQLESSAPERAAVALDALADDYVKSFRYDDAIPMYEKLLSNFSSHSGAVEKQSTEDDYHAVLLLKGAPPQTISFAGAIDLATHRNPVLGTIDADLTVNGVEQSWILDTGANFSTVSASFAAKLGVQLSRDSAQTEGITGAENKLQVAILPEMKLGGATIRNVVLLVLDDANLNVPTGKTHYQINAVLGYPVMQALQRITFTKDGHFLAGPDSPFGRDGARLYMDELTPLLECDVENRKLLFSFDTGADESALSDRYRHEFPYAFKGLHKKPYGMGGAGGVKIMRAYYLPEVRLGVGQAHPALYKVPVVPPIGSDIDRRYGNLGRDLVDPYTSFTIDFGNMSFLLGDALPPQPK